MAYSMEDNFFVNGDFEGFSSGSDSSDGQVQQPGATKSKSKKKRAYRTDLDFPIGTVERRNQRERYRVRSINSTFRVLEAMLPSPRKFGKLKKPSKADILRNAIIYIENLQCLVSGGKPSIRDIKQIHEQTTPQKGETIALPALELACNEQCTVGGVSAENPSVAKRSLYDNSCLYSERLAPCNDSSYPFHVKETQQWSTTSHFTTNYDPKYSEQYDFAEELGCSSFSFPSDTEQLQAATLVPMV